MTSLFFLPVSFFPLLALDVPKRPQGYVSDYAGLLSSGARLQLEEKLRQFEEETTNQVVVAIFPSLEGGSLEDFSIRLAEAWKVGQKEKDNGVILLIFKEDRALRIEVGYGLEGALPDATSKLIIENEIIPQFREENFAEGVERGVQAIIEATQGEYRATPASSVEQGSFGIAFVISLILGAILPPLLLSLLFVAGVLLLIPWQLAGWPVLAPYFFAVGLLSFFFYFLLGRARSRYTVLSRDGYRSSGGGFGGGFGGFGGGGGSFGGGGASGRW